MKGIYFSIIVFSLFLGSCVERDEPPPGFNLTGYWINISFISKSKQSGLGTQQFYCTEMNFDKDSVEIDNGFEVYKLKYTLKDSMICLQKAFQDMDLYMKIWNENYIRFSEPEAERVHANDKFNRVVDKEKANFKCVLNYNLIAGNYFIYEKDKNTGRRIEFTKNGEIKGSDYLEYDLCYSGDCLSAPDTLINIITLRNKNTGEEDYAWTRDTVKKQVLIYNLTLPELEIKGGRSVCDLLLDLREN